MRQNLRLSSSDVAEMLFQSTSNLTMQLLSAAPNQTSISNVLHERMLKLIRCVGRRSTLEDQLRIDKFRERRLQILFWEGSDSGEQAVRKLAAENSADCTIASRVTARASTGFGEREFSSIRWVSSS